MIAALGINRAAMLAKAPPERGLASICQCMGANSDNARRPIRACLSVFKEEVDAALGPGILPAALAESPCRQLCENAVKGLDIFQPFRLHGCKIPDPITNRGNMAIIRCKDHPPKGRTRTYEAAVEPVGHPESALVCGSKHCKASGLIWLEVHEATDYAESRRIFDAFSGSAIKMRAR